MPQHDMDIANAAGATARADINAALRALVSNNDGTAEPVVRFANMWWADLTAGIMKQRNSANTAWLNKFSLAGADLMPLSNLGVAAGNAQQVNQPLTATTRAATTVLGTSLNHELSNSAANITAFNGVAGVTYHCRALGAGQIVHHATDLIVTQTLATITTAAGDTFDVEMITGTTCRVKNYMRADGTALVSASITSRATINTTSGTEHTFTGVPSTVRRITIVLVGTSTNGGSDYLIQIGSGGISNTGYSGASHRLVQGSSVFGANYTTGFGINNPTQSAAASVRGVITLAHQGGNVWAASGTLGNSSDATTITTGGSIALGGALDRVRLTTVNGTDTFDAGTFMIMEES